MRMQCKECDHIDTHSEYKITEKGFRDKNGKPFSCSKCNSENLLHLEEEFTGFPLNIGRKLSQEKITNHFKKRAHEHYKEAIVPEKAKMTRKALLGGTKHDS